MCLGEMGAQEWRLGEAASEAGNGVCRAPGEEGHATAAGGRKDACVWRICGEGEYGCVCSMCGLVWVWVCECVWEREHVRGVGLG
jgi:hypothetical protein